MGCILFFFLKVKKRTTLDAIERQEEDIKKEVEGRENKKNKESVGGERN